MKNSLVGFVALVLTAGILSTPAAWAKKVKHSESGREAAIDARIREMAKAIPGWDKWEKDALNRKATIGMPQLMFDVVMKSWHCEEHPMTVEGGKYHNQYVCYGAFSKDPKELQGKYFYTDGRVIHDDKDGSDTLDGSLTAVQGE